MEHLGQVRIVICWFPQAPWCWYNDLQKLMFFLAKVHTYSIHGTYGFLVHWAKVLPERFLAHVTGILDVRDVLRKATRLVSPFSLSTAFSKNSAKLRASEKRAAPPTVGEPWWTHIILVIAYFSTHTISLRLCVCVCLQYRTYIILSVSHCAHQIPTYCCL